MAAQDYTSVVQQLYVSYFGRPADFYGLKNFTEALDAMNAPTTFVELAAELETQPNGDLAQLVGNFSNSAESIALYGNDNSEIGISKFVASIYQNFLGREADIAGFNFWVSAITSGGLDKANAVAAITAGALSNTSAQGMIDAKVVENKLAVATSFTNALDLPSEFNAYAGTAAADAARSLLQGVNDTTNLTAYQANVDAAVASIVSGSAVGATTQLTTGLDSFNGTAGNDLFIASVANDSASLLNTLSPLDSINGGAGIDTLRVVTEGAAINLPQLSNVEIIEAQSTGALNIDASKAVGVTNLNITKANGNVNATASATTDVMVKLDATQDDVNVQGGNNVTVTLTGVVDNEEAIEIGGLGALAPKGDVVVDVTGAAYATDATGTDELADYIAVTGGKTISVTQRASSDLSAAAADINNGSYTVSQADVYLRGNSDTTTVTVKQDAAVEAEDAYYDAGGTATTTSVKFSALAATESVTVGGLTFTAKAATTAAEVAAAFSNLINGRYPVSGDTQGSGTVAKGLFSGAITGWTSGAASTDTVIFTSTTTTGNVGPLLTSSTGAATVVPTPTPGTDDNTAATGGVLGVTAGDVQIADDANSITTVTIDGYSASGSSIYSGGDKLATLNLSNGGNFSTNDAAATLSLNLNKIWSSAAVPASTGGAGSAATQASLSIIHGAETLNVKSTGANAAVLSSVDTTVLNVSGTGSLNAAGSTLAAVKTITVTETAGLNLGGATLTALESVNTTGTTGSVSVSIDGGKASYTGGAGTDSVTVAAASTGITKSIDLGAGNDRLNVTGLDATKLGAIGSTITLNGGEGTDTLALSSAAAVTLSSGVTFQGKFSNFERLEVGQTTGNGTVNLDNMNDINYVVTKGGVGISAPVALTAATATQGVAGATEVAVVAFNSGLAAVNDSISIAGRTVTAAATDVTVDELMAAFTSTGNNPRIVITGALTGWTPTMQQGNQLTFTSTTPNQSVTNIGVSGDEVSVVTAVEGVTPVTESQVITFGALTAGQSYTVGGRTLTANINLTAQEVAAAFVTNASTSAATLSGTSAWTATNNGNASLTDALFTSNTPSTNVTDLAFNGNAATDSGTLTLDKMLAGATVQLDGAGSVVVNLADASGTSDIVNVISNIGTTVSNTSQGIVTVNKVETINITANDTDSSTTIAVSKNSLTLAADAAKTVNVSGAGNFVLTMDATTKVVTAVDASTATGAVTVTTLASTVTDALAVTVTGGAGRDVLTAGGNKADVLNGGAGHDILASGTGMATLTGGAGNDLFRVAFASETVNSYATITDFAAGDLIQFGTNDGANGSTFNAVGVTLGDTAVFQDYANAVVNAAAVEGMGWFQFGGNTYIVADMGANSEEGFVDGQDFIVKLTGVVDLSQASFNSTYGTVGL